MTTNLSEMCCDEIYREIVSQLAAIDCKPEHIAVSSGSFYFRVVTADSEEWRLFDKIRVSDHEARENDHMEPQFDFVEGAGNLDSDLAMLIEQCEELKIEVRKYA